MKRALQTAVFALCMVAFSQAATVPVQNMTPYSLGAEYYGMLNGHPALYRFDSSALASHFFRLHYTPISWLRFSAGFGGSHAYAEPMIEGTQVDISATAGLGLYATKLLDFLSITAGLDAYYLKASEKRELTHASPIRDSTGRAVDSSYFGDNKNGHTTAALANPYLGLIFHAGSFADIEIGGLYQYFDIFKKSREIIKGEYSQTTNTILYDPNDPAQYSYRDAGGWGDKTLEQVRIYTTLTLHERESGAYISGGFSYALTNQGDNDQSHLQNFSFWGQVGLMMRDPRGTAPRYGRYESTYARLKARQERMAGELSRDIERDRQHRAERRHHGQRPGGEQPESAYDGDSGDMIIINVED